MVNATMSISTVAAGALFTLGNLFVQQPHAAAVAYTLWAVAETAPRFLPTYNTTAEKVNSILLNLGPKQHTSVAHDVFVDEASTVVVSETPKKPLVETISTPVTTTTESSSLHGGIPVMLEESSSTPSPVLDETNTDTTAIDETIIEEASSDEATTLIAESQNSPETDTNSENAETPALSEDTGTFLTSDISKEPSTTPSAIIDEPRKSPEVENTSGHLQLPAINRVKGTSLTHETSEQPSATPDVLGEETTAVDQERSNLPVTSSLPNEIEIESTDEVDSLMNDELVHEPEISVDSNIASHTSTGPPVTPPSSSVVSQPIDNDGYSEDSEDPSAQIVFPSYAELVDLSRPVVRPFALFVVVPLMLRRIYNRFIRNHEIRQYCFRLAVGTFYAFVVAYLAYCTGPSGIIVEMSQPVFTAIEICCSLVAYVLTFLRECMGLRPTSVWHFRRNLTSTVVALFIDYLHFQYVKLVNMTSFTARHLPLALPCPRDMLPIGHRRSNYLLQVLWMSTAWIEPWHNTMRWSILAITVIGNLLLFTKAQCVLDLIIPFVLQAGGANSLWRYLCGGQAYQYFTYVARLNRRVFKFLASSPRKTRSSISRNKGWFMLYAVIIYAICVSGSKIKAMLADLNLGERWSFIQNTLTDLFSGWYQMRHDAEAEAMYFGQYLYWVYINPRDSWAAVKYYFDELTRTIPYADTFVQALQSAWNSVITSLANFVYQIPAYLRAIVNFCKTIIEAVIQGLFGCTLAIWTMAWNTRWCSLCISIILDAVLVFLWAFVFTLVFLQIVLSDVVSSHAVRRLLVSSYMFAFLVLLLLREECLQEIFTGIVGALLALLVFWFPKPFLAAVGGGSDHGGKDGKRRRIGWYPNSNGSDAEADNLENIVDPLKEPSPKDDDAVIPDRERAKEIEKIKLHMEEKRLDKDNFEKEELNLPKLVLGSTPEPAPRSAPRPASEPAPKPAPIIQVLPEHVLDAELSRKRAKWEEAEQQGQAIYSQQIGQVVAQSAKINKGSELALIIGRLGGTHPIVGSDIFEGHPEGIHNSLPAEHAPASTILPYSRGIQVPDGSDDDSSDESDKGDEKLDPKPDANNPAKKLDTKPEDDESMVPEPPSPIAVPEPEARIARAPPTPTTFARQTSLKFEDFPMPALYKRPANRSAIGVDSKEEWRNRTLGGPSILTQRRREREVPAKNWSNEPSGGDDGSSGDPPPGPAGDDGRTGGNDGVPPKPPVDKQDEDSKPSPGRKDDDDDDSSKPNGDSAPIGAAATVPVAKKVDDGLGDTNMDDAPENNDLGTVSSGENPIIVGDDEDAMGIITEDVPAELSATVASGDMDMGDAPWDGMHVNTNVAQGHQDPAAQNYPIGDPKLDEAMMDLTAVAAAMKAQNEQKAQAAQTAQVAQNTQVAHSTQESSSTQSPVAQPPQRGIIEPSSSQPPQQQTLPADQTVSLPGISTAPVPPPQQAPAASATQPPPQNSFLPLNTPTMPWSPRKPLVLPPPINSITPVAPMTPNVPVAPVAPIVPIAPVPPVTKSQQKLNPAPISTNLKLLESTNTPSAKTTPWSGNLGTADPFTFSTKKASSAQTITPSQPATKSQPLAVSQPTIASPLTQANVSLLSTSQTTQGETKSASEAQAKTGPVVEDGSGDEFSDISSLRAEEMKDTSEAEKMLANAMPATTNNGAQNVTATLVAAPPAAPQSPADSDQELEDAMHVDNGASFDEVAEAERVKAIVRNDLSDGFINSDDDSLSDVPDDLSDQNESDNDKLTPEKRTNAEDKKANPWGTKSYKPDPVKKANPWGTKSYKPDPVKKADAKEMAGRKIIPLKKRGSTQNTPKTATFQPTGFDAFKLDFSPAGTTSKSSSFPASPAKGIKGPFANKSVATQGDAKNVKPDNKPNVTKDLMASLEKIEEKAEKAEKADAEKMAKRRIAVPKRTSAQTTPKTRNSTSTASSPLNPKSSASAGTTPKASAFPDYLKGINTPTFGAPRRFTPKYSAPLTPAPLPPSPSYTMSPRPYFTPNPLRNPANLGIGFDAQYGGGTSPYKNPEDDPYIKRQPITYTPMAPGRTFAPVTVTRSFIEEDTSIQEPVIERPTFTEPDEKPLSPRPNGPELGDFCADNDNNSFEIGKTPVHIGPSWQVGFVNENGIWMKYNVERKGWEDEFNTLHGNVYHRITELEYKNAYVSPGFGDPTRKPMKNPADSPTSPRSPISSSDSEETIPDPYKGEIWTYANEDSGENFIVNYGPKKNRFWIDDTGLILYWDHAQKDWVSRGDGQTGCFGTNAYRRRSVQALAKGESGEVEDEEEPDQESDDSEGGGSEGSDESMGSGSGGGGGAGGEEEGKDGAVRSDNGDSLFGKSPPYEGWASPPPSPPPETDRRDYDGY